MKPSTHKHIANAVFAVTFFSFLSLAEVVEHVETSTALLLIAGGFAATMGAVRLVNKQED